MSTLKIVLIVIAVVVRPGAFSVWAAVGFIGYRIMKNTHVDFQWPGMTMNTPVGTITTTPVENVSAARSGRGYLSRRAKHARKHEDGNAQTALR